MAYVELRGSQGSTLINVGTIAEVLSAEQGQQRATIVLTNGSKHTVGVDAAGALKVISNAEGQAPTAPLLALPLVESERP